MDMSPLQAALDVFTLHVVSVMVDLVVHQYRAVFDCA